MTKTRNFTTLVFGGVLALAAMTSTLKGRAEDTSPATPPPPAAGAPAAPMMEKKGMHHDGPCKKIVEACEAAGFKRGAAKEGKGLHVNCIEKLLAGESVPNVKVDAADLEQCKGKAEHRLEKKAQRMEKMKKKLAK